MNIVSDVTGHPVSIGHSYKTNWKGITDCQWQGVWCVTRLKTFRRSFKGWFMLVGISRVHRHVSERPTIEKFCEE